MRNATKLYRLLLKFYPARFREEYEYVMERQFRDEYREAGGTRGRFRLWRRAIWDVLKSAPEQFVCELALDLKHSLRVHRTRLLSVSLAVIALGLAIGASTGVFSVVNALLLRSLPFSKPEQLVELWLGPASAMNGRAGFTEWRKHSSYLQDAATFSSSDMNLTGRQTALRVKAAETSANFFSLFGIDALVGRTFTHDEDILGHNGVAVIGYGLWQQVFGGDPRIIGKPLDLNGARLTIIGVAPASFDYPAKTAVWIPTAFNIEKVPKRGAFLYQTIGRLKSGITIPLARQMFETEARRANPWAFKTAVVDERNRPQMIPLQNRLAGPIRQASWALAGMTLLVLLTACANVAHLLLSRATERREELSIRAALGASRARLVQQLITEATFLTVIGSALGLLVAHWTARIASSVAPPQLATQQYTILDWRVLGFTVGLAIAMGIIFGVAPAWLLGRLQPSGTTGRHQSGTTDRGTKRARKYLIGLQAALTLVLLISFVTLSRAFLRLLHTNLGFHTTGVVALNVSLQGTRYSESHREWQYYSQALSRIRGVPGVQAAGAVSYLPLADNIYMSSALKLDSGQTIQPIVMNAVTSGYFRAMGTDLLAGRDFPETLNSHDGREVIVNRAFAEKAGLEKMIVGRRLTAPWTKTPYRIVGVINTMRIGGPATSGSPQVYWMIQGEPPPLLTIVAKVDRNADTYLARCRDALRGIDPQIPIYDVKTLDRRLDDVLSRPRFYTKATGFLAILAALLAAIGIYGTAAYSISQRKHEMGIRLAVGASYPNIRRLILRENVAPLAVGMAFGIFLSIASGRYLEHLVVNATMPAFRACLTASGILLAICLIAAWSATGSILTLDPADALRAE